MRAQVYLRQTHMVFKTLNGRARDVKLGHYLIDWNRKVSGPQLRVKRFLHPYWRNDTVLEEFPYPGGRRSRIDLYNVVKAVVVEVSPAGSHGAYNPFFHRSVSGYRAALKREVAKQDWCLLNGITYCELVEEDLAAELTPRLFKDRFGVVL